MIIPSLGPLEPLGLITLVAAFAPEPVVATRARLAVGASAAMVLQPGVHAVSRGRPKGEMTRSGCEVSDDLNGKQQSKQSAGAKALEPSLKAQQGSVGQQGATALAYRGRAFVRYLQARRVPLLSLEPNGRAEAP